MLPPGTAVTIQRNCVDNVVTEYGIARLRGKTARQSCNELISIAHPDFRAELRKEAERLFWPQL
jgi:acyl-CoA hydrolase